MDVTLEVCHSQVSLFSTGVGLGPKPGAQTLGKHTNIKNTKQHALESMWIQSNQSLTDFISTQARHSIPGCAVRNTCS